ncbi:amino acid adenylation domain protein [Aspergillus niger]|uniref:Amino acid adenylation domain protein n=1 Tax=Aspergillus niger TaxID=5061 RepID=A0A505IDN5_ASPNG|nr:amino acid adenylation domain protein [Aspergillus niger]GJP95352.1 amino acid adenylation domain protein [Aspergillus niger]
MPTSYGIFRWVAPNRADAVFDVDGYDSQCSLTLNPALPNFGTASAKLNYDTTEQLTGTHSFEGHIGSTDFETAFDNTPKIAGQLPMPVDQNFSTHGIGSWTQIY